MMYRSRDETGLYGRIVPDRLDCPRRDPTATAAIRRADRYPSAAPGYPSILAAFGAALGYLPCDRPPQRRYCAQAVITVCRTAYRAYARRLAREEDRRA